MLHRAVAVAAVLSIASCTARLPAPMYSVKMDAEEYDHVGRSTCTRLFGKLAVGDCSIDAAMRDGRIYRVHHVDTEVKDYILFQNVTTIVYGEQKGQSKARQRIEARREALIEKLDVGSVYEIATEDGGTTKGLLDQMSKSVAILIDEDGLRRVVKLDDIVSVKRASFGQ